MAYNPNATNFTTELNVINPSSYGATPYFTVNATGAYINGVLIDTSGGATLNAGASGVAGTVNIFPATVSSGNVAITASNNTGNTITNFNFSGQAAARTITVPDPGVASANVILSDNATGQVINTGTFTVAGGSILAGTATGTAGTLTIFPGTTTTGRTNFTMSANSTATTTTINIAAQAAARTITVPDGGVTSSSFLLTNNATTQTIATGGIAISGGLLSLGTATGTAGTFSIFPGTTTTGSTTFNMAANSGNTITNINVATQSGARTYTIPDATASASFVMTQGAQTIAGVKTVSNQPVLSAGLSSADNLLISVAAKGLLLKQGSNGKCGTFVANGVTPVTINNTSIAITDTIIISLNTVGGTVGVQPHVATITAASGFTVVCTAADTSTYNYAIISNAP